MGLKESLAELKRVSSEYGSYIKGEPTDADNTILMAVESLNNLFGKLQVDGDGIKELDLNEVQEYQKDLKRLFVTAESIKEFKNDSSFPDYMHQTVLDPIIKSSKSAYYAMIDELYLTDIDLVDEDAVKAKGLTHEKDINDILTANNEFYYQSNPKDTDNSLNELISSFNKVDEFLFDRKKDFDAMSADDLAPLTGEIRSLKQKFDLMKGSVTLRNDRISKDTLLQNDDYRDFDEAGINYERREKVVNTLAPSMEKINNLYNKLEKEDKIYGEEQNVPKKKPQVNREEFLKMQKAMNDCDPFYIRSSDEFRNAKNAISDVIKLTDPTSKTKLGDKLSDALQKRVREAYDYTLMYVDKKSKEVNAGKSSDIAKKRLDVMVKLKEKIENEYLNTVSEDLTNDKMKEKTIRNSDRILQSDETSLSQKIHARAEKMTATELDEDAGHFNLLKFKKDVKEKENQLLSRVKGEKQPEKQHTVAPKTQNNDLSV